MAACLKLGSKPDTFLCKEQTWFCTSGLPSDIIIKVQDMSFHLHKFPLVAKSGKIAKLVEESSSNCGGGGSNSGNATTNSSDSGYTSTSTSTTSSSSDDDENKKGKLALDLSDIPGGPETFGIVARFCYGFRLELTPSNVVPARCASEYLDMNEDLGEGNLTAKADEFLNQVVLRNWKECVRALRSCEAPSVCPRAEDLGLVSLCVDSVAIMACTDPHGWPLLIHHMSPGGTLLWNGISTGAKPKKQPPESAGRWWHDDVSVLSLPLFRRTVIAMESRGMRPESIAGALVHYAKKHLPGLATNTRSRTASAKSESGHIYTSGQMSGTCQLPGSGQMSGSCQVAGSDHMSGSLGPRVFPTSEVAISPLETDHDARVVLETIESLLPTQKGIVSTKFLSGLLRCAILLNVSPECKSSLERRMGAHLEHANLEDLLLPNLSYNVETLYDIDTVQRILDHFLLLDQLSVSGGGKGSALSPQSSIYDGPLMSPSSLSPMMMVARILDGYLAEIAPDVSLKPMKFLSLAEVLPEYSRICDDGVYRAIDIYLKAHPWLKEDEREQLCRIMDCQKLSLEACTHAAQNERLPLRVVVQVLFFEQLQLRTAIANCFMMSDTSRPFRTQSVTDGPSGMLSGAMRTGDGWGHDNQNLKVDMDNIRLRVQDLERECSGIKQEIRKTGKFRAHWRIVSTVMGSKFKAQLCRAKGNVVHNQGPSAQAPPSKGSRHDRSASIS